MKYIKTFEHEIDIFKCYWALRTDKYYFIKQLKKVKCPINIIDSFLEQLIFTNEDNIFVSLKSTRTNESWNLSVFGAHFVNIGYKFLGPIQLTSDEIEEVNVEKQADKFNL